MSVHEQMMGSPANGKALAYGDTVKYYRDRGWTYDARSGGVDAFEPPANATPEGIAEIDHGAHVLMARFGLDML